MLLPVRGFHNGRDCCALSTPKQIQNFRLLRFGTRLGYDRLLFGTCPQPHLIAGGRLRFSLCRDHFGLLPWIVDGTSCRHHHNPAEATWRWRGKERLSENQVTLTVLRYQTPAPCAHRTEK